MKECKNGAILPCYSDDTHDKVYELNKQMCDLESGLSNDLLSVQMLIVDKLAKDVVEGARTPDWAKNMLAGIPEQLSRAKYEILDEILKEKNRLMEEKKTKKMTKAEAFEWLKGKKVNTKEKGEEVQTKLFECGFSWVNGQCRYYNFSDYLLFETDGKLWHCGICGESYWRLHHFEEISADDILSIEIVEGTPKFSYEKVVELAKPLMEYLNDTGCTEQIGVSYDHIVAQPMATFLHGEMKGC